MKTTIINRMSAFLACAAALLSCTEKGPDGTDEVTFPEKVAVEMNVDETKTLSFKADADWSLSVDKSFVKFLENDVEKNIVSGKAGDCTVEVVMKDNGQGFGTSDMASITMKMDGKSAVIFEISRPAKERKISFMVKPSYQSAPEPGDRLEITYIARTACQIGIEANFDWYVKSAPKWVEGLDNKFGKAGVASEMLPIRVVKGMEPYSRQSEDDVIVISSEDNAYTTEFPLTYTGMPDNLLQTLPTTLMSNGITFNKDGRLVSSDISGGGEGAVIDEKESVFTVSTLNYDYRLAYVEYKAGGATEISAEDSWISVVEDKEKHEFTVSVKPEFYEPGANKVLYLYILPPAYKDGYDFNGDFPDGAFSKEKGIAMEVRLTGYKELKGFSVEKYNGTTFEEKLDVVKYGSQELEEQYGTDKIYMVELPEEYFAEAELMPYQSKMRIRITPDYEGTSWIKRGSTEPLAGWLDSGKWPEQGGMFKYFTFKGSDLKPYAEIPEGDCAVVFVDFDAETYTPTDKIIGVLVLRKK